MPNGAGTPEPKELGPCVVTLAEEPFSHAAWQDGAPLLRSVFVEDPTGSELSWVTVEVVRSQMDLVASDDAALAFTRKIGLARLATAVELAASDQ